MSYDYTTELAEDIDIMESSSDERMKSNPFETPKAGFSPADEVDEMNYKPQKNACNSESTLTKWFQAGMFIVFVVTLTLSIFLEFKNLSSGIVFGSGLSFISLLFVVVSYTSEPGYRRHPNPLIFWRTVADSFFVIRLLMEQFVRCMLFECKPLCNRETIQCGCSLDNDASTTCIAFSGIMEFSLIAAECWFLCMSVNLYFSLTNPFTDFKRNTKFFHVLCWGTGLVAAILLTSIDDLAGYSDLGVCWTNAFRGETPVIMSTCDPKTTIFDRFSSVTNENVLSANITSWVFFYVWMGLFITIGVIVWIWAWKRLSEGLPETYAVRVQSINRSRFYVIAVTIYWVAVVIVYTIYLQKRDTRNQGTLYQLMSFLLAGKGYVDLVVWFALNDFKIPSFKSIWKQNITGLDVDLNPQVNSVLRREVLFYTTSGIVQAVEAAERLPRSQRIQHLALLPQVKGSNIQENHEAMFGESLRVSKKAQRSKTFHDYEPHSFRRIRERFGVDNQLYIKSLSTTAKERLSEGASGAFMFFSGDGSLIVKSTSKEECRFLRSIAEHYADYLCSNPSSLLTRFYGCHCLELYGQKFSFVVMANLFDTEQVIHSRYDIKGSWVNRNAEIPKRGKKVTCRFCNRKYTFQSTAYDDYNCPLRLGGHEPNVVLKDNDLTQKLRLEDAAALDLYLQLVADTDLLCDFGIMDYSLLMGVHDVEYVVGDHGDGEENLNNTELIQESIETIKTMDLSSTSNPFSKKSVMAVPDDSLKVNKDIGVRTSNPAADQKRSSNIQNPYASEVQQPQGGMRMANSVIGPSHYHLGVIDILQTWTLSKQVERWMKILFKRVDGDGLSAVAPKLYKERFQAKMAELLGLQHIIEEENTFNEHVYIQQNTHMDLEPTKTEEEVQMMLSLPTNDHLISGVDSRVVTNRGTNGFRDLALDERSASSSFIRRSKLNSEDLSI